MNYSLVKKEGLPGYTSMEKAITEQRTKQIALRASWRGTNHSASPKVSLIFCWGTALK